MCTRGLLILLSLKLALGMVATASAPRSVLVTGATEGLGLAAAHQLVEAGHTVLVHGRNAPKVERVVASLEASGGKAVGYTCDLSDMAQVRRLGAEVSAAWPALDGLLNNAGSFDGDYTGQRVVTEEGNEYTLAVNVLAPFLLTSLLLPSLRASTSAAGRVVFASSVSMGAASSLGDLQLERGYSGHQAYSLSKLCDAMLSQELHARYGGDASRLTGQLTFNSMDPTSQIGLGADTKMLRAGWGSWGAPASQATISAEMIAGAAWEGRSGEGFSSRREIADTAARRQLWDECVRLTGAVFLDD